MIEIFILIYLSKKIKALAIEKGESGGKWIGILIASWFGAEIIGIAITFAILGVEAMIPAVIVGLAMAIGSYFLIKNILEKKDNDLEKDDLELDEFALREDKKDLSHFR